MKKLYSLMAGLSLLAAVACNDDDLAKYDTPDCRLNFLYYASDSTSLKTQSVTDEMRKYSFSFVLSSAVEAERDTVWFDVETMGFLADEERPVALRQIPVEGVKNAEPGVHYVAFDDPEVTALCRIEKGKSRGRIPVILLRAEELEEVTVVLKFGFQENEYFIPGYEGLDSRTMEITDRLSQPTNWYTRYGQGRGWCIANKIGHYDELKHRLMIEWTPLAWDEECIRQIMEDELDGAYVSYIYSLLSKKLREANEQRKAAGEEPYKDKDGDLISFESDYSINGPKK